MPKTTTPQPQQVPHLLRAVFINSPTTTAEAITKHVQAECWKRPLQGLERLTIEHVGPDEVHAVGAAFDVSRLVGLLAGWNALLRVDAI